MRLLYASKDLCMMQGDASDYASIIGQLHSIVVAALCLISYESRCICDNFFFIFYIRISGLVWAVLDVDFQMKFFARRDRGTMQEQASAITEMNRSIHCQVPFEDQERTPH